jgi:hypothetical protein
MGVKKYPRFKIQNSRSGYQLSALSYQLSAKALADSQQLTPNS